MTTIAWDGRLLCADSQASHDWILQTPRQKLFVFKDAPYVAIAGAGNSMEQQALIDWAMGGEKPAFSSPNACICIDREGKAWRYHTDGLNRVECAGIDGDGCGGGFAVAAMLVGASAFKAIETACRLDVDSGGPVQCFDFATRTLTGPFGQQLQTKQPSKRV